MRLPISPPGHIENRALTAMYLNPPVTMWGNLWGLVASLARLAAQKLARLLLATDARIAVKLSPLNAPLVA